MGMFLYISFAPLCTSAVEFHLHKSYHKASQLKNCCCHYCQLEIVPGEFTDCNPAFRLACHLPLYAGILCNTCHRRMTQWQAASCQFDNPDALPTVTVHRRLNSIQLEAMPLGDKAKAVWSL